MRTKSAIVAVSFSLMAAACSDDNGITDGSGGMGGGTANGETPATYEFASRFQDGSSVAYTGQTLRHVLIEDLNEYVSSLDGAIESDAEFDATQVLPALESFYEFDSSIQGDDQLRMMSTEGDPPLLQETYNDVAEDKDLAGKIAGQDSGGEKDHKDWSTAFVGWSDETVAANGGDISNPDGLIRAFFATLAKNAEQQVAGDASRDGLVVYLTPEGLDLKQLIQKFLLMAVTFSQGTDDYLDEGLTADNEGPDDGAPYSPLEHQWDEGFGYFGAARDYLSQSDQAIAAGNNSDADGDGFIDLTSEYNFGASVNAAKRDVGSTTGTDFTEEAMLAFLEGRQLITEGATPSELEDAATRAAVTWEKAIAATVVHYINDTLGDMSNFGTADYSFADHAKHWSELKGFALGLQFNPRSPLSTDDFTRFHQLVADAPVLADADAADITAYEEALLEARALLAAAYEFADDDVENW